MLRIAAARSNVCLEQGLRSGVRRQWLLPRIQQPIKRAFADERTVAGVPTGPIQATVTSNPAQTTSSTASTPASPPAPTTAQTTPSTTTLPPTGSGTSSTGPASIPPPPPPKRPRRRFRNFLLSLFLLSTLGYAGGVYYSLVSDNFHDFFTEYIPFGEDSVAYFEEREFRKRFPTREYAAKTWPQMRGEQKVTIGRQSGLTPKVAEEGKGEDLGQKGRHISAVEDNSDKKKAVGQKKEESVEPQQQRDKAKAEEGHVVQKGKETAVKAKDAVVQKTKEVVDAKGTSKPSPQPKQKAQPEAKPAPPKEEAAAPPVPPMDHLSVPEATEPVVQDVVKLLNNIITAVNASPEASKYRTTLTTAKEEVQNIISNISTLKSQYSQDAEDKIKKAHTEFEQAAKELVTRVDREMQEQEVKWREEYEAEREKLSDSYQQKLQLELDTAKKVAEQQRQNALLEREIVLQQNFMSSVRDSVESEREGRLAKLNELSSSVSELENLTSQWNEVVDATLQTQHLQVALEALRAKIAADSSSDIPTPFLNELVALKETSADSPLVAAAIASIPPVAYQRGIPSPAHLIDRFRRVASEVRKASLLPEDAGVASHAASAVLSRLMFTKKADRGLPEGEDVEATLARSEALLEEGDLDAAAREMNALKGWAGVLSRDWVAEVRRVLEVRMAVEVIATEARLQSLLVE